MASRAATRPTTDAYFDLIERFPLVPIRDDDHLSEAQAVVDVLLREELDGGGAAYLEVLTDLIERYEENNVAIPDAPEADVLRLLMQSNGLSQSALAREAGIAQSTISAVLNGSRSLTRRQVTTLSRLFRISPATFLEG